MKQRSAVLRLFAVLAVLLMLTAACGRDDDEPAAGPDTTAGEGGETGELTTGPGFDGQTIKLGVLTPLSGPVAGPIGLPLTEGNRTYVKKINEAGGIAGKYPIELVEQDNQYSTDLTKTKYAQVKDQVAMFAQILGTPPTSAVLVDLRRDRVMASPASLDAEWIAEEVLLPLGTPYQIQMINAAAWALEEGGVEDPTACFFGADDAYGEAGLEGVEFAGEEIGFDLAATTRYNAAPGASTDFTAQVTQMKNANCNIVFVTALPTQTNALLTKASELGFEPEYFIGNSPTWVGAFAASPLWQKNFVLAAEGTEWGDTSVPGMAEMLADVEKFAPEQKPDIYFVFGYYQMKAVTELLEKAVEMGDLSREGILNASKELGTVEFQGLTGDYTYGPVEERQPPRGNTLYRVNAQKPGGLEKITEITSEAAEAFEFQR